MAVVGESGSGSAGLKSQSGAGVGVEIYLNVQPTIVPPPSKHARDGIRSNWLD